MVMSSIPVWASLGLIGPEQWSVRPYLEARVGYPIPAATLMTWWDKPYNFFVTGTVGVQLPYHVGVEFDCTYLTMDKYFAKYNVDFRLTSLKIGGSITVHFDLSGKSSEPGETFKKSDFVVQGAVEESSSAEPLVDANEEQPAASEEQTFSDYSSQPAEEPAVQENADIPNAVESQEQPEEESGEPSAEEASAEESASDDAAPEEVSAEDTQSDEADDSASAEEVAAEEAPAESAVEEPASEPAVEKTAQKASVKKNTKKSKSKKASKKSKKSSKKSAKKKSAKKKR